MAHRYDLAECKKAKRLKNGWLRADAILTRAGIFTYAQADGSVRRELRPEDEVFHADSLDSLRMVPVTLRHPQDEHGVKVLLDSINTKLFAVGHVGDTVERADSYIKATLTLTDAHAVKRAEDGSARQMSCGYNCDLDETPGTHDGQRYDAVQRNIRYNHVALEPIGRAGPEVALRLDAGDAVQVDESTDPSKPKTQENQAMAKIRLDGVDFEASEQLAQAITVANEKAAKAAQDIEAQLKAKSEEVDAAMARADSLDEELKKAKEAVAGADDPAKIAAAVKARVALEMSATKILGSDAKFDAMTDADIKRAVVEKVQPAAKEKLTGATDAYLAARYDAAVEAVEAGTVMNPELAATRKQQSTRTDAAKAREEYLQREANAWKQPTKDKE